MKSFADQVAEWIAAAATDDALLIESACEESLGLGDRGVRVLYRNGRVESADADTRVPPGMIYFVDVGILDRTL